VANRVLVAPLGEVLAQKIWKYTRNDVPAIVLRYLRRSSISGYPVERGVLFNYNLNSPKVIFYSHHKMVIDGQVLRRLKRHES
jgi:hypothetical protein